MIHTLKIKLHPAAEQRTAILETMERFNAACNFISSFAFERKIFSKKFIIKCGNFTTKEI